MSLSTKDYVAIAEIIRNRKPLPQQEYYGLTVCDGPTLAAIAQDLCCLFRGQNPRFDQGKFLKACGVLL